MNSDELIHGRYLGNIRGKVKRLSTPFIVKQSGIYEVAQLYYNIRYEIIGKSSVESGAYYFAKTGDEVSDGGLWSLGNKVITVESPVKDRTDKRREIECLETIDSIATKFSADVINVEAINHTTKQEFEYSKELFKGKYVYNPQPPKIIAVTDMSFHLYTLRDKGILKLFLD